jgi:hypothetical protein
VPIVLEGDDDEDREAAEDSSSGTQTLETLDIPLPKIIDGAEFLVSFFYDAGICWQTGNGIVALPWSEIMCWAECCDYTVARWQMVLIRKMSEAYCSQHYRSDDPRCPAPWLRQEAPKKQDAKVMNDVIKSWLQSHKHKKR